MGTSPEPSRGSRGNAPLRPPHPQQSSPTGVSPLLEGGSCWPGDGGDGVAGGSDPEPLTLLPAPAPGQRCFQDAPPWGQSRCGVHAPCGEASGQRGQVVLASGRRRPPFLAAWVPQRPEHVCVQLPLPQFKEGVEAGGDLWAAGGQRSGRGPGWLTGASAHPGRTARGLLPPLMEGALGPQRPWQGRAILPPLHAVRTPSTRRPHAPRTPLTCAARAAPGDGKPGPGLRLPPPLRVPACGTLGHPLPTPVDAGPAWVCVAHWDTPAGVRCWGSWCPRDCGHPWGGAAVPRIQGRHGGRPQPWAGTRGSETPRPAPRRSLAGVRGPGRWAGRVGEPLPGRVDGST